jgi:hypothetical protein
VLETIMTFSDWLEANLRNAPTIRDRLRMRYAAARCRIDPAFAIALETELADQHGLTGKIDWSQIDWAQVAKIVLMILAAFGVL